MAKTPFAKRDEEREVTRRALIKWTLAAGAALGVSRGKIMEILERTAGKETAFAATENSSCRTIHLVGRNGGLAWATLLFPQVDIAKQSKAGQSYNRPGMGMMAPGTAKPLWFSPDTPWQDLPPSQQFTGFVCGNSSAHSDINASTSILNGNNVFSFATALQASTPAVIPVVAVNGLDIGTSPGGATATAVGSPDQIVGLFNSAASRAGGLLSNSQDATTYAVQYAAFAQLNRASSRSTQKISYNTAVGAAGLLGVNLAAKLAIQPADLQRYGATSVANNIKAIAQGFIVAVKAFKAGLTNSVVLPFMGDDPHPAFADGRSGTVPAQLKMIFDGLMADLKSTTDEVTNKVLADDTVITIMGDTPKDCTQSNGWPDGTRNGSGMAFVYSAGHLKSGWFGNIDSNGAVTGFDQTGADATFNNANTAKLALASIAYAVAKGDERAIAPFANGVTISNGIGIPKQL